MATLADIRTKIRRLTRSPAVSQISDNDIDTYVNNFLLYDFPSHLRLNAFRKTLTFYLQPNVDIYDTNTIRVDDPLYDFKNLYITQHDPVYINGYRVYFTQSRADFYALFPQIQGRVQIGTGDGITTNFTGTLTGIPILQNEVLFSSIDANNYGLSLSDVPRVDIALGVRTAIGDLVWPNEAFSRGTINYITGVYDITFPFAPAAGEVVYARTVRCTPARPTAVLYYDTSFMVRPVPDMPYKFTIETYARPTTLGNDAAAEPFLEQYWTWIAYGAAKRIFEDRMDMESVQMIMPEYKQQELLCLRRTIVQQADERVSTIYAQALTPGSDWNRNNFF